MSQTEELPKELDEKYMGVLVKFISDVRNGKLKGSSNIALATITMLQQIISDSPNASAYELCDVVRGCGRCISRALPDEMVATNMVRRVLRAIRDEQRVSANQLGEGAGESLQRLVLAAPVPARRATISHTDLQESLRDQIAELRGEVESSLATLSAAAGEHVHADELILTYGACRLVGRFLRAAAARRCRLLLAEGTDVRQSHSMAVKLSQAGVSVTVITAASIFAVMSRVNKVVVGVRAALSGGAVLAECGMEAVTLAARYYNVPVIALAPLYKLSPIQAYDQQNYIGLGSPHQALPYELAETSSIHVYAPKFDFIPPDNITLFITNLGASSPSYIYRLLSELYDPKDYQM